jgi:hypothetical protein
MSAGVDVLIFEECILLCISTIYFYYTQLLAIRSKFNNNPEQIPRRIQVYVQSTYPAEYHDTKYVINSTNQIPQWLSLLYI